ncbi:MAG: 3-oxoacyl-ACP reductase FabG [Chloroflexi bacterium]|nr:3-oxoacyl-ACP reductase FabG [Chloroflexota bacterium]
MSLAGKVALVTGSGRNIGRATVLELAGRGADVVVNARANRAEAEAVAREAQGLGVKAIAFVADVADQAQVDRMVSEAVAHLGPIDILVNNAGLRKVASIVELSVEEWREVVGVNMDGPFYLCKAVVPGMIERGWGRIINVSGLNAFKGRADWAHVCASKMGALGLTRGLAVELAPHGILVNHIVPGAFDTSRDGPQTPSTAPQRAAGIPLGRLGLPEEVAKACAFLASDEASFITGQTIHVNGGALAG